MSQIRIKYVRDSRRNPVGCIAYSVVNGEISMGIASCNPSDPFKKEVSRSLAIGRLFAAPEKSAAPEQRSLRALTKTVLEMTQRSERASNRVARLAAKEAKTVNP